MWRFVFILAGCGVGQFIGAQMLELPAAVPSITGGWLDTGRLAGSMVGMLVAEFIWSAQKSWRPAPAPNLSRYGSYSTVDRPAQLAGPDSSQILTTSPVETLPAFPDLPYRVTAETVCAGSWPRLVAFVIDYVLTSIPNLALAHLIPPGLTHLLAFMVVEFLYFAWFWTETGSTPGKHVMGLAVVDRNGQLLDLPRALARYASTWVSLIFLGLGYFWVLWDPRHEAWHDKLAGTKVIKVR